MLLHLSEISQILWFIAMFYLWLGVLKLNLSLSHMDTTVFAVSELTTDTRFHPSTQ